MSPLLYWRLANARPSQHQVIEHPLLGFVASYRSTAHLHPPDDLLGAIIGPRHVHLPVENPVVGSMFTQPDEQQAELIQGRQGLIPPGSALWDFLPQFEQSPTAFLGQLGDQELDFVDHPHLIGR